MTVEEAIEAALFGAVHDLVAFDAAHKAWPNVVFNPPAGEAYLRVSLLPNSGQRFFMNGYNPHLYLGILQLTVVAPLNAGSSEATRLAGEVAIEFPADRTFYESGINVRIERAPDVGQAFPVDASWNVPVSVRYDCIASQSLGGNGQLDFSLADNSQYIPLI